jgi:hypothetical protein
MNKDINAYRARVFLENYTNGVTTDRDFEVVTKVMQGKGVMKREDIVRDTAKICDVDVDTAREIVSCGIDSLKKSGKIRHADHGYWELL